MVSQSLLKTQADQLRLATFRHEDRRCLGNRGRHCCNATSKLYASLLSFDINQLPAALFPTWNLAFSSAEGVVLAEKDKTNSPQAKCPHVRDVGVPALGLNNSHQ